MKIYNEYQWYLPFLHEVKAGIHEAASYGWIGQKLDSVQSINILLFRETDRWLCCQEKAKEFGVLDWNLP